MFRALLLVGISVTALSTSSAEAVTTFSATGAAQSYSAAAGIYAFTATGAHGGSGDNVGGAGIEVGAHVTLGTATSLSVIVGGAGGSGKKTPGSYNTGGGGGGSFVINTNNSPVVVAGGGGGGGSGGPGNPGGGFAGADASVLTRGGSSTGSGTGFGGANGGGGQGGIDVGYSGGGGGGGGLSGAGMRGGGSASGSGGTGAPTFAGGRAGGSQGFGGFGSGGGGGFSGGGGGTVFGNGGEGGGGGGSFTIAGATDVTSQASTRADGNGSVSIEALRYFAIASVPDTLAFAAVRSGTAATASLTVGNGAVVSEISDKLVVTLGTLSSTLISSAAAPGPLAAGQVGVIDYTWDMQSGPGILSESVTLGFSSHAASGADFALGSKTIAVTGTVTDVAYAFISSMGNGTLTFTNGNYVLDLGDITAGSIAYSQFNIRNDAAAASYGEALRGAYTGLSGEGFSFAAGMFNNLAGGAQLNFGTLGFNSAGLTVGSHSQTFDIETWSRFAGLEDLNLGNRGITVLANVINAPPVAGVPEPATWGLMLGGFGMIGAAMRRWKRQLA